MNFRQQLHRPDSWLHLDVNIQIAIVVVVTLMTYVLSGSWARQGATQQTLRGV